VICQDLLYDKVTKSGAKLDFAILTSIYLGSAVSHDH